MSVLETRNTSRARLSGSGQLQRMFSVTAACALAVVGTARCGDSKQTLAVAACADQMSGATNPVRLLIGTDGVQDLCECTVGKVYERVPDADAKVEAWLTAVESRSESRGLLGVLGDTTWFHQRANELDTFGSAFGPALMECTKAAIKLPGTHAAGRPVGAQRGVTVSKKSIRKLLQTRVAS